MFMNWKTLIFSYLFIYFWLHGVFVAMRAFSSYGEQGFSCITAQALGPLAQQLWHMGFRCSAACGIFPDHQVLNPYLPHWQMIPIHSVTREVSLIFLRMTLFPKLISRFNVFPEFVGEKVVSPSYSYATLALPSSMHSLSKCQLTFLHKLTS